LVVLAILAVLIGAIAASLAAGLRVWEAVRTAADLEMRLALGLRLVEKDLANAVPCAAIGFQGDAAGVEFPGLGHAAATPAADPPPRSPPRLVTVRYWADAADRRLWREKRAYLPGQPPEAAAFREAVLEGVDEARFSYVAETAPGQAPAAAAPAWNNRTNFPAAVRLRLTVREADRALSAERTMTVPARLPTQTMPAEVERSGSGARP
jgi:hypothetical protein